jgi:CRISPR system Cascade subunit CasD
VHLPDTAYAGFGTSHLETLQSYIATHFATAERSPR